MRCKSFLFVLVVKSTSSESSFHILDAWADSLGVSRCYSFYIFRKRLAFTESMAPETSIRSLWKSSLGVLEQTSFLLPCPGLSLPPTSLCARSLDWSSGIRWPLVSAGLGSLWLRTQLWQAEATPPESLPWSQRHLPFSSEVVAQEMGRQPPSISTGLRFIIIIVLIPGVVDSTTI